MLSANIVEHMLKAKQMKNDEGSYEGLERDLLEYLTMVGQQAKNGGPSAGALAEDEPMGGNLSNEDCTYTEPWWDEHYQRWVCAVSEGPRNRMWTEDDTVGSGTETSKAGPVKGEGEGQRQDVLQLRRRRTVCTRAPAPKREVQVGNWTLTNQWSQCNPGFIPRQWNYRYPGNPKGKGESRSEDAEGEGDMTGLTTDGNLFSTPQFGAVVNKFISNGENYRWIGRLASISQAEGDSKGTEERVAKKTFTTKVVGSFLENKNRKTD